jgi:hypothetical protein
VDNKKPSLSVNEKRELDALAGRVYGPARGSGNHRPHRKRTLARYFRKGTRSWFLFWETNRLFLRLGFGVERAGPKGGQKR